MIGVFQYLGKSTNGNPVSRPTRSAGTVAARWTARLLVAVAALVAAPPTLAQTEIWSATLSVKDLGPYGLGCRTSPTGHREKKCSEQAVLTDNDFTYDNTDYVFKWILRSPSDELWLKFENYVGVESSFERLTLHIDDKAFLMVDADNKSATMRIWHNPGLDWSAGNSVLLRITEDTQQSLNPLTATFEVLPETHNGSAFSFQIAFSEDVAATADAMRDHALVVGKGKVTNAGRMDGRDDLWSFTVTPSTSDEDVTILLLRNRPCNEPGAICTGRQRRLSKSLAGLVVAATSKHSK